MTTNQTQSASVSARTLNILAATVWYVGSLVLLLKAGSLLAEAKLLNPNLFWLWMSMGTGLVIGGLKAKYIFSKSCKRNLARIAALEQPKPWQFFKPGFFLGLALMITAGATLSRMAQGNYPFLLAVAALDLTIAIALLGSSVMFWKQGAFEKESTQ